MGKKTRCILLIIVLSILITASGGFLVWRFAYSWKLSQIVPLNHWTLVDAQLCTSSIGTGPVQRIDSDKYDDLSNLLSSVTVKKASKMRASHTPFLKLCIQSEAADTFELVIYEDGNLTYALYGDLQKSRTYWKVTDRVLFRNVLEYLPGQ